MKVMNAQEWLDTLKQLNEAATPGPWEYSTFNKPDGGPIETIEDVAETTAHSARYGPRAELFGICTPEKDEDGRNKVIGYTGNGPTSDLNAYLIVEMRNNLSALLDASYVSAEKDERIAQLEQELKELQATFDLRWDADMRAIKLWQQAHPGKENIWPDHVDLCMWLLERAEAWRQSDHEHRIKHQQMQAGAEELLERVKELEAALRDVCYEHGRQPGIEGEEKLMLCSKCLKAWEQLERKGESQ